MLIDSHVHLYESPAQARRLKESYVIDEYGEKPDVPFCDRVGVVQDLIDSMQTTGITKAIVLNLFASSKGGRWRIEETPGGTDGSPLEHDPDSAKRSLTRYNEWLAGIALQHPQLIPFASIDPWIFQADEAADYVRQLVERGQARGLKIHPNMQGVMPTSPVLAPVFRTCEELEVPIISHCGPAHGGGGAVPSAFLEVLGEFPRLRLVLAHIGGAAWREAPAVARSFDNVYFDCAEILPWIGATRGPTQRDVALLISEIGAHRVLLGSDFPWYEASTHITRIMDLPLLSADDRRNILGSNAARVLLGEA